MGARIIIHLGLLITFGLTESTEHHPRADPDLNLECFIDYINEVMCILTPAQLDNCTEYSINASRDNDFFMCDFKQLNSNACECLFYELSGFVVEENYEVKVLKRNNVLISQNVSTTERIKPKKPFIVSVNQTQDRKFHIVWDTVYSVSEPTFNNYMISELTYYVEGNNRRRNNVTLMEGQQEYWLQSNNLESNSNYIVRARMRSTLNLIFSDYSDPYRFTTPRSPNDNLMMIISIMCIILICIFSMYIYFQRSNVHLHTFTKITVIE